MDYCESLENPPLSASKLSKILWTTLWSMRNWQPYYQTPIRNFFGFGNLGLSTNSHVDLTILFCRSSDPPSLTPFLLPPLSILSLFCLPFSASHAFLFLVILHYPATSHCPVWTVATCVFPVYAYRTSLSYLCLSQHVVWYFCNTESYTLAWIWNFSIFYFSFFLFFCYIYCKALCLGYASLSNLYMITLHCNCPIIGCLFDRTLIKNLSFNFLIIVACLPSHHFGLNK